MFCMNCGRDLVNSPDICPNCNVSPLLGTKLFNRCGVTITALMETYKKFGVRLIIAPGEYISWKSRPINTLLVLFLGMFGTHRFYTRKIGTDLAMLILTVL